MIFFLATIFVGVFCKISFQTFSVNFEIKFVNKKETSRFCSLWNIAINLHDLFIQFFGLTINERTEKINDQTSCIGIISNVYQVSLLDVSYLLFL